METVAAFNPIFDATSHAHPLPATPTPGAFEEQRIRAMVARHSIAVKLRGLSCKRAPTVTDVLLPNTRRSPFDEDNNPSHLDLTECWKGLSQSQATELTMWYHFFHACLQEEVRDSLCDGLVKTMLRKGEHIDEIYSLSRILESLWSRRRCVFDINFVDLIDKMMGMFHDQFPCEAASVASNWSQFSGGLSRFLHNFLRMQDCFRDRLTGPCLEVEFDFQYAKSAVTAIGVVAWQNPEVRFLNLHSCLSAGKEYTITPFTPSEDPHISQSALDSNHYVDETTYTISRSPLSFSWDAVRKSFVSILPSDDKERIVETVVDACTTTLFPDHIKFERQSRWSIKLGVWPAGSNPEPWWLLANMTAKHVGDDDASLDLAARHALRAALDRKNHKAALEDTSRELLVSSAHKRKATKSEVIAEFGRRRHGPDLALDAHFGGKMAQESSRPHLLDGANDEDTDSGYSSDGGLGAGQPKKRPLRAPSPTIRKRMCPGDSRLWSPAALSSDSDSSVAYPAVDVDLSLQQQQIRRNYQEFADRKLHRTSGLIDSPVSEGEFRAYERIFMDDGEVCSPFTDESAVDLDAVMGGV